LRVCSNSAAPTNGPRGLSMARYSTIMSANVRFTPKSRHSRLGLECFDSFVTQVLVANANYGRLESGEFSFKKACGTTVPRLDGAFCGVNVTIDDLKVWQAPKIE